MNYDQLIYDAERIYTFLDSLKGAAAVLKEAKHIESGLPDLRARYTKDIDELERKKADSEAKLAATLKRVTDSSNEHNAKLAVVIQESRERINQAQQECDQAVRAFRQQTEEAGRQFRNHSEALRQQLSVLRASCVTAEARLQEIEKRIAELKRL